VCGKTKQTIKKRGTLKKQVQWTLGIRGVWFHGDYGEKHGASQDAEFSAAADAQFLFPRDAAQLLLKTCAFQQISSSHFITSIKHITFTLLFGRQTVTK
jgi:hypothetical protein